MIAIRFFVSLFILSQTLQASSDTDKNFPSGTTESITVLFVDYLDKRSGNPTASPTGDTSFLVTGETFALSPQTNLTSTFAGRETLWDMDTESLLHFTMFVKPMAKLVSFWVIMVGCGLGLVLNALSAAVFARSKMRSSPVGKWSSR